MQTERKNRKSDLLDAAVRLVASGGAECATTRAIAREAGVSDAALYRHYRNKDDLCGQACARIADEMIRGKRELAVSEAPISEKLHTWVRLTYEFFDKNPDEFAFYLSPPNARVVERGSSQAELFAEMIRRAIAAGEVRPIHPQVAVSHFTGLMLNVPRLIRNGVLDGPASAYVDEVADAARRVLCRKRRIAPPD
jgi:AcrR family transcriptional regulator